MSSCWNSAAIINGMPRGVSARDHEACECAGGASNSVVQCKSACVLALRERASVVSLTKLIKADFPFWAVCETETLAGEHGPAVA